MRSGPTSTAITVFSLYKGLIRFRPARKMREIAVEVAARHGLDLSEVRQPGQAPRIIPARQEAMSLQWEEGYSNLQVARWWGRKDHTTVVHARHQHAKRLALHGSGELPQ